MSPNCPPVIALITAFFHPTIKNYESTRAVLAVNCRKARGTQQPATALGMHYCCCCCCMCSTSLSVSPVQSAGCRLHRIAVFRWRWSCCLVLSHNVSVYYCLYTSSLHNNRCLDRTHHTPGKKSIFRYLYTRAQYYPANYPYDEQVVMVKSTGSLGYYRNSPRWSGSG